MKQNVNVSLINLLGEGDYQRVREILRGGQKISVKKFNLLNGTSSDGIVDVVYDVNENDHFNRRVVVWAVKEQQDDIAIELIKQGANIDVRDDFGETFVGLCAELGRYRVLKVAFERNIPERNKELVKREAEKSGYVSTPLHKAAKGEHYRIAELLLKNGADPNVFDHHYLPVIAYPIIASNKKMVKLLLKFGARADLTNVNGVDMLALSLNKLSDDGYVISRMLMYECIKHAEAKKLLENAHRIAVHYKNEVIAGEIEQELKNFA